VSFYELKVDDGCWQKQKSSGILVCPGTGSTSWHLNVNHVSFQAVQEILRIGWCDCVTSSVNISAENSFICPGLLPFFDF